MSEPGGMKSILKMETPSWGWKGEYAEFDKTLNMRFPPKLDKVIRSDFRRIKKESKVLLIPPKISVDGLLTQYKLYVESSLKSEKQIFKAQQFINAVRLVMNHRYQKYLYLRELPYFEKVLSETEKMTAYAHPIALVRFLSHVYSRVSREREEIEDGNVQVLLERNRLTEFILENFTEFFTESMYGDSYVSVENGTNGTETIIDLKWLPETKVQDCCL